MSSLGMWVLALVQTQYTGTGDPTTAEQYVLELINRARANPTAEGTRLATNSPYPLPAGDITEGLTTPSNVGVRPPLAMNANLLATARAHSLDMYTRDYFAHDTLSPPTQTWAQRINAGGYTGSIGENIATSSSGTAAFLEDFLMVDWTSLGGYPGRGHRSNLLDVDSAGAPYREIGVGYYQGASPRPSGYKDYLTQDFGRNTGGPFIVGVVYNDANTNSFYNPGEEMAGVTVRLNPAGTWYAVTATAGGYAFPYSGVSGTLTVEATGGAFGAGIVSKVITRTGENVKLDFKLSDMTDSDGDGMDDAWEMTHFLSLAQTAGGDPDGDGYTNLQEFQAGTDPMDPLSKPAPPPPKKSGGGGGGCGLTGLDALALLALLRLLRRSAR